MSIVYIALICRQLCTPMALINEQEYDLNLHIKAGCLKRHHQETSIILHEKVTQTS